MPGPQVPLSAEDIVQKLVTLIHTLQKPPAPDSDPLRTAIQDICGPIPELTWDKAAVVKEPRLWLLYLDGEIPREAGSGGKRKVTLEDVRDGIGGPGRLLVGWLLRAEELWFLSGMDHDMITKQQRQLKELRASFILLATTFFSHPVAKGTQYLLRNLEPLLLKADAEIASLDSVVIEFSVGKRQASEFARLRSLHWEQFGPRSAELVGRLSFRGHKDDEDRDVDGAPAKKKSRPERQKQKRIPAEKWAKMSEEERNAHKKARKR